MSLSCLQFCLKMKKHLHFGGVMSCLAFNFISLATMKWHQILNPKVVEIMCKTTPLGQWHWVSSLPFITPVQVMDGSDNLNQHLACLFVTFVMSGMSQLLASLEFAFVCLIMNGILFSSTQHRFIFKLFLISCTPLRGTPRKIERI